jgi:heat shock protein HslJ
MKMTLVLAAACALLGAASPPPEPASAPPVAPTDAAYFVGTWHCADVQWTFAPILENSGWIRVTYGDPRRPAGMAVMGWVPQQKRWIYRDFHADGSYADLTSPGAVNGRWEWTGPYYPAEGGELHGRVTYAIVDSNQYDRIFEALEGGAFVKHGGDSCVKKFAPHTIESNPWAAIEIGGHRIVLPAGASAPTLAFDATQRRVTGSTGCNNLAGDYQQGGGNLTFSSIATTRRACPPPFDALENRFLKALAQTASSTISGDTLVLLGGGGERLIVLQATR